MSFFGPPAAGVDAESLQKEIDGYTAEINKQAKAVMKLQKNKHKCDEKEAKNAINMTDAENELAHFLSVYGKVPGLPNTPENKKQKQTYEKKFEKLTKEIRGLTIDKMSLSVDCGIVRRQLESAESLQRGMEAGLLEFKKKYKL
jgi:predicted  nucleic acid-binding Zn-ribbon protein